MGAHGSGAGIAFGVRGALSGRERDASAEFRLGGRSDGWLYGRRHGHGLRPGRRKLIADLLPTVRLAAPETGPIRTDALFPWPVRDLWLEVGFGSGEHLAAQACEHRDVGLIGCEVFVNGIAALLARMTQDAITNVRIFDDDARLLMRRLPDASVGRVFVLFPDPWPKTRHAARRFVSAENLDTLARLMRDGAELRFASDHAEYVRRTLDLVGRDARFAWPARTRADWRRPGDAIVTRYEAKAERQGRACVHLRFVRRSRN